MDNIAFALREAYTDTYEGGVLAAPPDGRNFDVADALRTGDGTIVVSSDQLALIELLRAYPPLKEVPAPEGRRATRRAQKPTESEEA